MERTAESRIENLLWIALQAIAVANREAIGTEYQERISSLRDYLSSDWDYMRELSKPVIGK